jgi:hypothetical protein
MLFSWLYFCGLFAQNKANLFRRLIMNPDVNRAQGNQSSQGNQGGSIQCGVANCQYQNGGKCSAKQVRVGPQYANSSADTVCDTFKPAQSDGPVRNKYQ